MSVIPTWLPVSCAQCKHLNRDAPMLCAAFPEGIPVWIRGVENPHRAPEPGDHGIRFEPSDEFLKMLEEEGILTPAAA